MLHVLVETNWIFSVAAPAHHKRPDAVELLDRARRNKVQLHVPAPCLTEARRPTATKCQPRHEADAIRQFLLWARSSGAVSAEQERVTREVLDRFEQQVRAELRRLETKPFMVCGRKLELTFTRSTSACSRRRLNSQKSTWD